MSDFLQQVSLTDLQVNFDADLLEEANAIRESGGVSGLNLEIDGSLYGDVTDDRGHYHVTILPRKKSLQMTCQCGRMRERPCKHVLALLMEWVSQNEGYDEGEEGLFPAQSGQSAARIDAGLYPPAGPAEIRTDWQKRLEPLTVRDMRELAQARGIRLKGTLRDQITESLLQTLVDPAGLRAVLEGLPVDSRRLLDLLCLLPGAAPYFHTSQILPRLKAALPGGPQARPVDVALDELKRLGLYQASDAFHVYPVPLQVEAQPLTNPGLVEPYTGQPQRIEAGQPFHFTRLALRLLLLAQAGELRCAPRPKSLGRGAWPQNAGTPQHASEAEIPVQIPYLESGLRASLASGLALPEEELDLAAVVLEEAHLWARRAPQRLSEKLEGWMEASPQEQSRRLFNLALHHPSQLELDLARQAGVTPWRNPRVFLNYQEFLTELGWNRLRLARLLARVPGGQWLQMDSILRMLYGLQPGWRLEFFSGQGNVASRQAMDTDPTWATLGRSRPNLTRFDDWRRSYGQLHQAVLTHTLRWLGLLDVGWQDGRLVAVRLTEFGEFLVGRRPDFPLPAQPAGAPALVIRPDWAMELDLDSAPLDLVNLLMQIASLEKPDSRRRQKAAQKMVYRIHENGLGKAFEAGWTLDQIVGRLEAVVGAPLPGDLVARIRPLWERFGRLQIYEDMTLIEFSDDFCLPELLAATSLSQILVATFSQRLVAVRSNAASEFLNELQAKGYTPRVEGGRLA